jgi:hypothetical protein
MPHAPENARKCEGIDPHTPKGNSHFGNWSPGGLLNLHRAIEGVKTHWIEAFLTSLERSWNLNILNGLT